MMLKKLDQGEVVRPLGYFKLDCIHNLPSYILQPKIIISKNKRTNLKTHFLNKLITLIFLEWLEALDLQVQTFLLHHCHALSEFLLHQAIE